MHYEITNVVAQNDKYTISTCNADGQEYLIQVANGPSNNDVIARNAYILAKLTAASAEIEAEYKSAKSSDKTLNYDLGFPELCDQVSQDAVKANVIRFKNVEKVSSVIPLLKIWKSGLRIDLRTSAWVLGKLLKIVAFAHDNNIKINNISGNNILIEPDKHYVLIFDWSRAVVGGFRGTSTKSAKREEVKLAAQCVIKALGGDLTKAIVNDADLPYVNYLESLATSGESDANKAHQRFYTVIDGLCSNPDSVWKPGFYEFSTVRL